MSRYFYTISGSIDTHTLDEAFNVLHNTLTQISNTDHLKISIQGPNDEEGEQI